MKFWDTSALVPLVVDEPSSKAMRDLVAGDAQVAVWQLTSVELLSVVARLGRTSRGLDDVLGALRRDVLGLLAHAVVVTDVEAVRRRAERLVSIHPLAAADAMQLAAALVLAGDHPETLEFVTLDRPLARSAELEGFHGQTA